MKKLYLAGRRFWAEEKGVTAIEYGLIAALIAVGIIVAVTAVGDDLVALFNKIAEKIVVPA